MTVYRQALVTGASSGIGAAFAALLPDETDLLLTARRRDRLLAEANRHGRAGRTVATVIADLATETGRAEVIDQAAAREIDLVDL